MKQTPLQVSKRALHTNRHGRSPSRKFSPTPTLLSVWLLFALGCPGSGSEGSAPRIQFNNTLECIVFAGGFPSGFTRLEGDPDEAAVVQFIPTAVLGLTLATEPPSLLATTAIPGFPELSSPICGGVRPDSDSDGLPDPDRSDALGFNCQGPAAGSVQPLEDGVVGLVTSSYEQIVLIDPRTGELRFAELDPPPASATFDPADWPFWPEAGVNPFRTGFSTRACVYQDGLLDSNDEPLISNRFCDPARAGFVTSFSADLARIGNRIFVSTSNLIRSSRAQYAPGTVLAFEYDPPADGRPARIRPASLRPIILTSGFNPTALTPYTTPSGRELLLVTVSGAIALGTGSDLVLTDSAVDVLDAVSGALVASIPLGRAGLGFTGIAIDSTGRVGLLGAATGRQLFAIDLAALDDPALGTTGSPALLDGSSVGFRDARLFDAESPFALPSRAEGPPESLCTTQTSVAAKPDGDFAVASDFCDGTLSVLDLTLPADRTTPLNPNQTLQLRSVINATAPLVDGATGQIRAIDRVSIRAGSPGTDFTGPEIHFTAGLPEGAVCGIPLN